MNGTKDGQVAERRGLLRALSLGTAAAAASVGGAAAQRADSIPAKDALKENEAQRKAARYRESEHVKAFYRTNAYEG